MHFPFLIPLFFFSAVCGTGQLSSCRADFPCCRGPRYGAIAWAPPCCRANMCKTAHRDALWLFLVASSSESFVFAKRGRQADSFCVNRAKSNKVVYCVFFWCGLLKILRSVLVFEGGCLMCLVNCLEIHSGGGVHFQHWDGKVGQLSCVRPYGSPQWQPVGAPQGSPSTVPTPSVTSSEVGRVPWAGAEQSHGCHAIV